MNFFKKRNTIQLSVMFFEKSFNFKKNDRWPPRPIQQIDSFAQMNECRSCFFYFYCINLQYLRHFNLLLLTQSITQYCIFLHLCNILAPTLEIKVILSSLLRENQRVSINCIGNIGIPERSPLKNLLISRIALSPLYYQNFVESQNRKKDLEKKGAKQTTCKPHEKYKR